MSVDAMSYVWKTPLKGSQKLMLLAIADRADEVGVCYPGVVRLAKKCSIEKRGGQKLINKLEEIGEIVVVENDGIDTRGGKTNRYYMKKFRDSLGLDTPQGRVQTDIPINEGDVQMDTTKGGVQTDTGGVSKRTSPGVSKSTRPGVSKRTPNTSVDTTGNPTDKTTVLDVAADTATHDQYQEAVREALQFETVTERGVHPAQALLQIKLAFSLQEVRAFGMYYRDRRKTWSGSAHIRKAATIEKYATEFRDDTASYERWMAAVEAGDVTGGDSDTAPQIPMSELEAAYAAMSDATESAGGES